MSELLPEEYLETFPVIGARNWRYKQEVSETVADHLTFNIPRKRIAAYQIAELLRHPPNLACMDPGTTRYCHPVVEKGMDWFNTDIENKIDAHIRYVSERPKPNARLVNGWGYRFEFERLGDSEPLWITQPVQLPKPEDPVRNSGQRRAELKVSVSASGMRNRTVGLFAEVLFETQNEYVNHSDIVILGKIDPRTGIAQTPYHRLSDNIFDKEKYKGCRPTDGTLFVANRMANFVINELQTIS